MQKPDELYLILRTQIGERLLWVRKTEDGSYELHFDKYILYARIEHVSTIKGKIEWPEYELYKG